LYIYLGQLVVINKIWSVTVDEGAEGETILEAAHRKFAIIDRRRKQFAQIT